MDALQGASGNECMEYITWSNDWQNVYRLPIISVKDYHVISLRWSVKYSCSSMKHLDGSWNVMATTNIVESGAKHHNHSHICRYGDCNTLKFPHVNTTVRPIKCIEENNTLPLMIWGESEYRPFLVVGAVVAVIVR